MILPIYTYGQAVLREETKPIDSSYPELQQLIADMFETMYNADGIGLAAPQIGRSIKLLVIDGTPLANDHLDCKDFKRVLINPEIVEESPERVTYEEGCLSFPGVHERVTRAERIRVKYLNASSRSRRRWADSQRASWSTSANTWLESSSSTTSRPSAGS